MENLRSQLAAAQEAKVDNPGAVPSGLIKNNWTDDASEGFGSPLRNTSKIPEDCIVKNKKLSEISQLKAKVHQLQMINQQLRVDNFRLKSAQLERTIIQRQQELELEFATELGISDEKFDWNSLAFKK